MAEFTRKLKSFVTNFLTYSQVPLTEKEIKEEAITDETWRLAYEYYRNLAERAPTRRIVSFTGLNITFEQAAEAIKKRTKLGKNLVEVYKGFLLHIGKRMEELGYA